MIGGAFSNNILSLLQAIIENNIDYHLILLGPPHNNIGNALFTQIISIPEKITWVSRREWNNAYQIIEIMINGMDEKIKNKFVSYPIPKAIIKEHNKVFK